MSSTLASTALERDTLIHRLYKRAAEQPEQVAYTFLSYGKAGSESLTYRELDQQARSIGSHLYTMGANGKPVLLFFPSGLEYISAYFGCLYAGAIAVPAYMPHSARDLPRIQAIISDVRAEIVLATTDECRKATRWFEKAPDLARLAWIATDNLYSREVEPWQGATVTGDTLAFLQYTSGSTTMPRGVMVSHGNLMHNLAMIHRRWNVDEIAHPVGVSWLPMFHDMGLIMGILAPLYSGYPVYLMSPADFLQRPLRWLQAISDYRGTFSCAPNFAYELCVHRVSTEDLANLDLSCWQGAGNAAEPVRSDTLEHFTRFFSACGFPQTTFRPGYGLAEATLIVTCGTRGEPVYIKAIDKERLEEGYVEAASESGQQVKRIVGCGRPIDNQSVVIVDPGTLQRCENSQVGEIWVSGPSVAQGYWRRPEETAEVFQAYLATGEGPFLHTGDLGVFQDENLFITGRSKDLIILSGRNLYPQDIELTVEQAHPAIRAGCCVVFSYEREGEERLVILAEINHRYLSPADVSGETEPAQLNMQEIIRSVRKAVTEKHEVRAHEVVLLKIGGILKTSSGKLQRRACRQAFLQGTLKAWYD
jgi:acyl-CoA synthetase (AMP-forming)/AMP-acid ligase II